MSIITLTTDLGDRDFYVPAIKGFILRELYDTKIVDITHKIKPFNIAEASFVLKASYKEFPEGTVHLIGVTANMKENTDYILVSFDKHYFVAADDGIIPLIIENKKPDFIIKLNSTSLYDQIFPLKNVMVKAACDFLKNEKNPNIGKKVKKMVRKTNLNPILDKDQIRGSIIYVDNFGNAITNIKYEEIRSYKGFGKMKIIIGFGKPITKIHSNYNSVEEGDVVCVIGMSNFLEISVNKGNAEQLLGQNINSKVIVKFEK